MNAYTIRWGGWCLVLSLMTAWVGCDRTPPTAIEPAPEGLRVVLDVAPLYHRMVAGVQQECLSVADRVLLTVEAPDGLQTLPAQPVSAETPQVVFDSIVVMVGAVTFQAEVRSVNEVVLYAAEETVEIQTETYAVELDLEKQAPVLQVCPTERVLTSDMDYFSTFDITNRGRGVLPWSVEEVGTACDGEPCLGFEIPSSEIAEGETGELQVFGRPVDEVRTVPVRITSPVGAVEATVRLEPPPNRPPAITSAPATRAEVGQSYRYLVTAEDQDGDAMTFPMPEIPAWLTFTDQGGGTALLQGTPAVADAGAYDLVLQVQDEPGATDEQRFTLTVEDNVSPVARADTATADEDQTIVIEPLLNDTDPQDRVLQLLEVTQPMVGSVDPAETVIFYVPAADYAGPDAFAYVAANTLGYTDTAAVEITVNPSIDDFVTLEEGRRYTEDDADADGRIYTEHTVPVYLRPYQAGETFPPEVIWTVDARELGVFGFGSGKTLVIDRSTLDIRFEKRTAFDDRPVHYVSFDLYDLPNDDREIVNFSVNDDPLYVATALTDKAPVPAGVRLIVQPLTNDGSARRAILLAEPDVEIRALRIGGDRVVLDNVRFGERQP